MGLLTGTLPSDLQLAPLATETETDMAEVGPAPWLERASQNRPDLKQLEDLVKRNVEQLRAAKGLFMPSVTVSGSWGFDRTSNAHYGVEDQSSAAALEFQWEIFSGGSRRARVRQAESARAETAARLNRLRLNVNSEVRQAVIDLKNTQQQIVLRREGLATAKENRRIVQIAYVAGKETLTRLNETQRDYIAADADLVLARIRLRQSWSDLYIASATYRRALDENP
jgi:outer membrane protein TolC